MPTRCEECYYEAEWHNRYKIAEKRFDKALRIAVAVTTVAVIVALCSLIITIFFGLKAITFMNSFEYVEEIQYQIEQDRGINVATIGGESEVQIYGTEDNCSN